MRVAIHNPDAWGGYAFKPHPCIREPLQKVALVCLLRVRFCPLSDDALGFVGVRWYKVETSITGIERTFLASTAAAQHCVLT